MAYRPKWQIALEEVDRAEANGVHLDWLTFDEGYGKAPEFVRGLDERHVRSWAKYPRVCRAWRRMAPDSDPTPGKGRRAEEVVRQSPAFLKQRWRQGEVSRQTVGAQIWEVKAAQVWQMQDKAWSTTDVLADLGQERRHRGGEVLAVQCVRQGQAGQTLLRVAFCRWNVETDRPHSTSSERWCSYSPACYNPCVGVA